MILKDAQTVYVAPNPWSSDDGKVTIWTIKLEVNGSRDTYSTMSKALAREGFSGDVEVYTNTKGKTYVRQAPKEEVEEPAQAESKPTTKREWLPESPERQDSINRSVALNNAAVIFQGTGEPDSVLAVAAQFYEWLRPKKPAAKMLQPDATIEDINELVDQPINLDDIPF